MPSMCSMMRFRYQQPHTELHRKHQFFLQSQNACSLLNLHLLPVYFIFWIISLLQNKSAVLYFQHSLLYKHKTAKSSSSWVAGLSWSRKLKPQVLNTCLVGLGNHLRPAKLFLLLFSAGHTDNQTVMVLPTSQKIILI